MDPCLGWALAPRQLLSLVEDTQDSYKVERSLAEQVEVEFQSKPLVKPPQMESWLSLPRLVRWGVHRVRLLGVEEALAKRPSPRTKCKWVPLAGASARLLGGESAEAS